MQRNDNKKVTWVTLQRRKNQLKAANKALREEVSKGSSDPKRVEDLERQVAWLERLIAEHPENSDQKA